MLKYPSVMYSPEKRISLQEVASVIDSQNDLGWKLPQRYYYYIIIVPTPLP